MGQKHQSTKQFGLMRSWDGLIWKVSPGTFQNPYRQRCCRAASNPKTSDTTYFKQMAVWFVNRKRASPYNGVHLSWLSRDCTPNWHVFRIRWNRYGATGGRWIDLGHWIIQWISVIVPKIASLQGNALQKWLRGMWTPCGVTKAPLLAWEKAQHHSRLTSAESAILAQLEKFTLERSRQRWVAKLLQKGNRRRRRA